MAFDAHANFAYSTVAIAPVPALTGLSLTVAAGQGALFPAVPFNCTVWPAGTSPLDANAEIVRVTAVIGDTLTIVRAQEGSGAIAIAVGDQIANTTSVKVFSDIESVIIQGISAVGGMATASVVEFSNANGVSFGRAGQTITASVAAGGGLTNINLSAGTTSQNLSAFTFSNSNGISFGLDAALSQITASYTVPAQSTQPVAASASNGSFLFSTLGFSNANNVTFGTSAGGIITASVVTAAQSTQPVAASASNGSFLFSTLGFSNANNVTFGTSAGSIVTASVSAQSVQPVAASASGGSFLFSTLNFSNTNNISFFTSAGSAIYAGHNLLTGQFNQAVSNSAGSFSFQTLNFSNANNVTWGTSAGNIVTASVAAQSVQPVAASASNGSFAFSTLGFSNANGVTFGTSAGSIITASVGAGGAAGSISAGTTSVALGQVVFSNSNNVTFGLDGSTVTASVTVASTQGNIIFSAGTNSPGGVSFIVFSDSNRVSFGKNGSTITAKHAINFSGGTTSNDVSDQLIFSNSNNVSFGLGGSTLTASATVASTQGSIVVSAGTTSTTGSQFVFSNSNNVSFGLNGSTVTASFSESFQPLSIDVSNVGFTKSVLQFTNQGGAGAVYFGTIGANSISAAVSTSLTNINVSAGTTSNNLSAITFANAGGVSFGLNGSTITASAPAAAPSPVNFSAGTTSSDLGSVVFSNSNGVSFGLSGSTITASAAGGAESNWVTLLGANVSGNSSASGSTLGFSGLNLTLSGTNNSQIVFSVPATSSLVGTGGLTVSTAGSTISVSLIPIAQYEPMMPMGTNSTTFLQPIGQWWFIPFVPDAPLSGGRLNFLSQFGSTSQLPLGTTSASWGSNTSGQKSMRYQYSLSAALFSLGAGTNSTRMESLWSNQHSFEISHNVSISGAAGASLTVSMGGTLSGILDIDSNGGVTTTTYGGSSTISSAASNINSTANSSILSSMNNMLSGSHILPIPFNTTINAGNYFLGVAWSTASTTGGSSQVGFAVVNAAGLMNQSNITAYRMWGLTTTNVSSQVFPGRGAFSASSAAPPATIAFTNIRTKATNAIHYCNWVNSNAITV